MHSLRGYDAGIFDSLGKGHGHFTAWQAQRLVSPHALSSPWHERRLALCPPHAHFHLNVVKLLSHRHHIGNANNSEQSLKCFACI